MPTFKITAPDGKAYQVTGENQEGAVAALKKSLNSQQELMPNKSNISAYEKDIAESARSGIVKGGIMGLELPEMLGRAGLRLGQEGLQAAGLTDSENIPVLNTSTGKFLRGLTTLDDYEPQSKAAKYAGTVGEFIPAAVGGPQNVLRRMGTVTTAGIGSEALGQAFEDTALEIPGRLFGGLFAPATLRGIKNKTVNAFTKKANTQTSLETLRDAKNASYKAFETSGGKLSVSMDDLFKDIIDETKKNDIFLSYAPDTKDGQYIDGLIKSIQKHSGKRFNLAELDKLRSSLYTTYKNSGFDPRVRALRDKVDDVIENTAASGDQKSLKILEQARINNRSYKKVELFDELIEKAKLQTASTGSGGNIGNKYRQAFVKIVTDKKNAAKFDEKELQTMKKLIEGNIPDNVFRLLGKLSPSGNGLMTILNVGAVLADPSFIIATAIGTSSKIASDKRSNKAIQDIRELLAPGMNKGEKFSNEEIRTLIGFSAGLERETETEQQTPIE